MTLKVLDPIFQIRCDLCGSLFLAIDDEHDVRLSHEDAKRLRMNAGDMICFSCWFTEIVVDRFGRPTVMIGHA